MKMVVAEVGGPVRRWRGGHTIEAKLVVAYTGNRDAPPPGPARNGLSLERIENVDER